MTNVRRSTAKMMLLASILAMIPFSLTFAQEAVVTMELRPYCDSQFSDGPKTSGGGFAGGVPEVPGLITGGGASHATEMTCQEFAVKSPSMLETETLEAGDVLDMMLVLENPSNIHISDVRAWIVYDPSILKGETLLAGSAYHVPTPGDFEFSETEGYAKIHLSPSPNGAAPNDGELIIARVSFRVLATTYPSTVLNFYDVQGDANGHTYALTGDGEAARDALASPTMSLFIPLQGGETMMPAASSTSSSSSSSSVSTVSSVSSSSIVSSVSSASLVSSTSFASSVSNTASKTFGLLQVLNLRVTTEGTSAFLAWDPLPSSELIGYNVYYGTISGEYLQRRSVDRSATSLSLRGLPENTTYYFAVRGANGRGDETEFSQEVAVMIGKPSTSTAPLTGAVTGGSTTVKTPSTGGTVSGKTGSSSALTLLLLLSAVIGTGLAFRRQLFATTKE